MSVRTWELKTCTGRTIRIVEADGGEKSESTIDVDGELMMKVTFSGARGKWKRRGILEGAARGLRSKLEHKARWRRNKWKKEHPEAEEN